jgi:hypothetical protein
MNTAAVMSFDLKCMSLESDQKRTINSKKPPKWRFFELKMMSYPICPKIACT